MIVLQQLFIATAATIALVVGWSAVQSLVRRHSPEMAQGDDVLACRMCGVDGSCSCGLKLLKKETSNAGKNDAA